MADRQGRQASSYAGAAPRTRTWRYSARLDIAREASGKKDQNSWKAWARASYTSSDASTPAAVSRSVCAGDRDVMLHGAYTGQEALEAGVLDGIEIQLRPGMTRSDLEGP